MIFATKAVFADGTKQDIDIPAPNWHAAMERAAELAGKTPQRISARPLHGFRPVVVCQAPPEHRATPLDQETVITPVDLDALHAYDQAAQHPRNTPWLGDRELASHLPNPPITHTLLQLAGGLVGQARNAWALYSHHRRMGRSVWRAARMAVAKIWHDIVDPVFEVRP